jgi:hypothetical protein
MRIATALLAAALATVAAPGCSSAQRGMIPPRVTVQSLMPLSEPGGQRFRVSLVVDNPNTEPLSIRALEFQLRLADQGILDGRSDAPLTIEALDRETVTLDLSSDIVSSLSRLLSFVQGPENALPYQIDGTVTLARRRPDPLRFSAQGRVPLVMTGER